MATYGRELSAADLYRATDPSVIGAESSASRPSLNRAIGQERAFRALDLGTALQSEGFNIFVLGLPASGRTTLVTEYLRRRAATEPTPDDLCYVNNFSEPHRPLPITLPPGKGIALREAMDSFVERSKAEIKKAFAAETYRKERDKIAAHLQQQREDALNRLQIKASKFNFTIIQTPFGLALAPAVGGKPIPPEELEKLDKERKAKLEQVRRKLESEAEKALSEIRSYEENARNALAELNRRTIEFAVGHLVQSLKDQFPYPDVAKFLDAVQKDIAQNPEPFLKEDDNHGWQEWKRRYAVNVLVSHKEGEGAPVVVETHPSYYTLLGRVDHEVVMGASRTDHTLIRPGALHRANGGYLVLPARELLLHPYAWEGLKRALSINEIRIVELAVQMGWLSTLTLEPEPVALKTKVVLIGTPMLYYLLQAHDEDFKQLFKVRAEFAPDIPRTPESEQDLALFVRRVVEKEGLPHFHSGAIARVIEESARWAESKNKLSAQLGNLTDLLREAAYWAQQAQHEQVLAEDVERAIAEKAYRASLLEERIREEIANGVLLIDVSGKAVGRINALSVIDLGDYVFSHPTRVSATAYPGRGDVIDIESRTELGGPIHTKGVLILGGFLAWRYGRNRQLSLSARLTFEQSYENVEGDSASAAELIALLSAIGNIPLHQGRAITGSINQHGQIQAIGGVNEKIEGFFAVCREKGLTGEQGVIIPEANVADLMLRAEVRAAVEHGEFHIWAVNHVDQAIALLSDMEPGTPDEEGNYPEGTFNHAVQEALRKFSDALRHEDEEEEEDDPEDKSDESDQEAGGKEETRRIETPRSPRAQRAPRTPRK